MYLFISVVRFYEFVKSRKLTSSHNLPPAEANTRERGVCWGPFTLSPRQRSPDPGREASPPAPLIYDWMSAERGAGCPPGHSYIHIYEYSTASRCTGPGQCY